jgi:DNA repair protein RecO (recombination protein O)
MAIVKTSAVVLGSFALGESDRVVTFFTRHCGKVRGVAKGARRLRSRFGGALELLTLGELVFFDNGRSDLVHVDHFDIVRPFQRVRDDLERLGQAAWIAECLTRLTAERDPSPVLYGLLVRALAGIESGHSPRRLALVFGLRGIDVLGHRLRIDVCTACGRRRGSGSGRVAIDLEGGGLVCAGCARGVDALDVGAGTVDALRRLRGMAWAEAVTAPFGRAEPELRAILDAHVTHLIGQPPRTARFVREVERLSAVPGNAP